MRNEIVRPPKMRSLSQASRSLLEPVTKMLTLLYFVFSELTASGQPSTIHSKQCCRSVFPLRMASIEAFKAKLKLILDESNALSRKVKEVALNQKQKERDFVLAKRAIERIRMAI